MKKLLLSLLTLIVLLIVACALYLWISDCSVSPFRCGDYPTPEHSNAQKIAIGGGPEDMAIDSSNGGMRLIVSCDERRGEKKTNGQFYAVNLDDHGSYQMTIEPADFEIHPHGIDIVTIDSISYLYAISHHEDAGAWRHPVVRFIITGDTLIHDVTYENEVLSVPNDLKVLSDGSFYATNYLPTADPMDQYKAIMGVKNGSIAHYDGQGGWSLAATDLCFPNGIWIDEAHDLLYVANGACHEVLQIPIVDHELQLDQSKSSMMHGEKVTIGDNLLLDDEGQLWITAHPCPLDFIGHAGSSDQTSPIQVYQIDPNTMKPDLIFQDNGAMISAASTAIMIEDRLYISQVFDPYILVVDGLK